MTTPKSAARNWPSLYGDFRQGFLTTQEVASRLWEAGYTANEAFDVAEVWDSELSWDEVAADQRIASRS